MGCARRAEAADQCQFSIINTVRIISHSLSEKGKWNNTTTDKLLKQSVWEASSSPNYYVLKSICIPLSVLDTK